MNYRRKAVAISLANRELNHDPKAAVSQRVRAHLAQTPCGHAEKSAPTGGSESWEPADPGNVRWKPPYPAGSVNYAPRRGAPATGADPPCPAFLAAAARPRLGCPGAMHGARYTRSYSERCCGIPASRARTSVSLYRRWPPSVRMDVSLPALAQRVTVFGSTRNIVATSAGVRSGSASGVRADMCTASPPGPALRSCFDYPWLHWKPAVDVPYGLLEPYCHHQP